METAFIRSEFWRKLALLCAVVLMLLPGTVFAIPLQQTEQVTLNLQNQTAKTIGYVFISPNTNTKWRQNRLGDKYITVGKSLSLELALGCYDIIAANCNSNVQLEQSGVVVQDDHNEFIKCSSEEDAECNTQLTKGMGLYRESHLPAAVHTFGTALDCNRNARDRARESARTQKDALA